MRKISSLILLAALLPQPAFAETVKDAANRVTACIKARDAQTCRDNITASSVDIYNRFVSYDLMDCLPQKAAYVSSTPKGDAMLVRATVTTNDKKSNVRLIFQQEEDRWKLDIPETLRQGIGDNWEGQVNATEQVYLMLKKQMGGQLNCSMIRNLGAGLTTHASN